MLNPVLDIYKFISDRLHAVECVPGYMSSMAVRQVQAVSGHFSL